MRRIILISIFMALLLFTVAAYSVAITLSSDNVAQLGGTGNVKVNCPANSCQINRVRWVISETHPYKVSAVDVTWTPASSATYDIYVTLYDNSNNVISSGSSKSQSLSGGQETTTRVSITSASPEAVYYVEIIIVQTG
ncbi:MAG: hypothetical protein QXT51_06975 [Nitrososphaerota archaeon]